MWEQIPNLVINHYSNPATSRRIRSPALLISDRGRSGYTEFTRVTASSQLQNWLFAK
ncbi:hypothetical protein [Acinetobacter phage ABPH49]|nr:hypothetical protein [Acinetobacter phage ABPH49]